MDFNQISGWLREYGAYLKASLKTTSRRKLKSIDVKNVLTEQ